MKLATLLIGFVIFSMTLALMFAATQDILDKNKIVLSDGQNTFGELAGDYEELAGNVADQDSTTRDLSEASKQGVVDSEDRVVQIQKGAITGGRLSINFLTNFESIMNNATGDANKLSSGGQSYIDNRVIDGIGFILLIILVLAIAHFIRGFKTET
jgi:hypothetical protein|tara:strand:- start:1688 stop:2155 length:468 start_codon:yes stop_codon:yes gene_type:complete